MPPIYYLDKIDFFTTINNHFSSYLTNTYNKSIMLSAIAKTIKKSLLDTLPTKVAGKFDIDESEFKEFLENYLSDQLAGGKISNKKTPGGIGLNTRNRKPTPKGKNGKGKISGYILFCKENRSDVKSENPEMTSREITTELGRMWKTMEDSEKQEWNNRAKKMNIENGLGDNKEEEKSDKEEKVEKSDKEDEEEKSYKKSKKDKKKINASKKVKKQKQEDSGSETE
jgi:hypothetical protein